MAIRDNQPPGEWFVPLLDELERHTGERVAAFERLFAALTRYIDSRLRGHGDSAELVWDTLERLNNKLERGDNIDNPLQFAFGIARTVLKEYPRKAKLKFEAREIEGEFKTSADLEKEVQRKLCIEKCLGTLTQKERTLFLQYYSTTGHAKEFREELAKTLNLTLLHLRVTVFRVRSKVVACLEECRSI